jgi:endonuclease/exonuclease/phosphatase family metal-dependent hydrolase
MKIASWNIEGRLTRYADADERGSPEHILREIEAIDADVIALPDAFHARPERDVNTALRKMGYEWRDAAYGDVGREEEYAGRMPHMRLLSKLAITSFQLVRWADCRTTLVAEINDPETNRPIEFVAEHADDRSKYMRLMQTEALAEYVDASDTEVIVLGDRNEMHPDSWRARLFGSAAARTLVEYIPSDTVRRIGQQFVDMAEGDAIRYLEKETNLRSLDTRHRPTTTPKIRGPLERMPSIRVAQLDHIYVSPGIHAEKFTIARDGGSDHRALSAIVRMKESVV